MDLFDSLYLLLVLSKEDAIVHHPLPLELSAPTEFYTTIEKPPFFENDQETDTIQTKFHAAHGKPVQQEFILSEICLKMRLRIMSSK